MPTALFATIAPYFVPYLEMICLTGESYYFRKESTALRDSDGNKRRWHPKIDHRMLRDHHSSTEGILYAALPSAVRLHQLKPEDLLYIGCCATGGSRFWRGRTGETLKFPKPKSCFHHEPMRRGRGGSNLEHYLATFGAVTLYTMTNTEILELSLRHQIALPDGKYAAHRLERAILAEGFTNWKWNARC
jgi:hypothetical protein